MFYEQHINEQFEVLLFKICFYLYWLGCYTSIDTISKNFSSLESDTYRIKYTAWNKTKEVDNFYEELSLMK